MIPLAHTANISRDEWLEIRKKGIGGSEVSAIMGDNPWSSPLQVYLDKLGLADPIEETEQMYFGKLLEPVVAQAFTDKTGLKTKELRFVLQHDLYPFLLANIDRVIDHPQWGRGILECKTTNAFNLSDWENGNVPRHYMYQVQHYLGVTGYSYAYIACLIGGSAFRYVRIERDEPLIAHLQERATDFWYNCILPKNKPNVSHMDGKTLSGLFPQHEEDEIYDLHEDETPLLNDLFTARRNLEELKKQKALTENRIKERMAFCGSLYYQGEKLISWKTNKKQVRVFKVHCDEGE